MHYFEPLNMRFDPARIAEAIEQNTFIQTRINRAAFVTKVLRLQKIRKGEDAEKLVPSTNLFNLFGFTPGTKVVEETIGKGKGLLVRLATLADREVKKVYQRTYKNRKSAETLMDIRHQEKITEGFAGAKKVHLLFSHGKLTITPIFENEVEAKHLSVAINNQSAADIAADLIHAIKNHKIAQVSVTFEKSPPKNLVDIIDLQLRREGYTTIKRELSVEAIIPSDKDLKLISLKDLPTFERATANLDAKEPLTSFVACTGGVDAHIMENDGFTVNNLMDFSPIEKRDWKPVERSVSGKKTRMLDDDGHELRNLNDKREIPLINALINTYRADSVALFNEDLFLTNINILTKLIRKHNFLHFSLCCQEFSLLKSKKKQKEAIEAMTTSRDMFAVALEIINRVQTPTILFENVVPFNNAIECEILIAGLEKMGYRVTKEIVKATDFNGYTTRNRTYIFATLLEQPFAFPETTPRTVNAWDDIIAARLMGPFQLNKGVRYNAYVRDVSHTKTIKAAVVQGRDRFVTQGDDSAPAIPRAQSKQVKDAVYIKDGDTIWFPKPTLQRALMGIPDSFNTELFSDEVTTEIIGNSIEVPQHTAILWQIKTHILNAVASLKQKYQSQMQLAI